MAYGKPIYALLKSQRTVEIPLGEEGKSLKGTRRLPEPLREGGGDGPGLSLVIGSKYKQLYPEGA
jgi:hypothetical protein